MSNIDSKPHLATEIFSKAFQTALKCKPDEFIIQHTKGDVIARIYYNEQAYMVNTWDAMLEGVKCALTNYSYATEIQYDSWHKLVKGVIKAPQFFAYLFNSIDESEATTLNMILTITVKRDSKEKMFWKILSILDNEYLYGKAIVAAAKCLYLDDLAVSLLVAKIRNGENEYNEIVKGTFSSVSLTVGNHEKLFYIYTIGG